MPCMVKPDQQACQVKHKTLTLKETGHIYVHHEDHTSVHLFCQCIPFIRLYHIVLNPSNAEGTFIQGTKTQTTYLTI